MHRGWQLCPLFPGRPPPSPPPMVPPHCLPSSVPPAVGCQRAPLQSSSAEDPTRGTAPAQVPGQNGVQMPKPKAKPRVENNRVLVTGGAGFVGSHLCTYLVNRGDHVRLSTHQRTRVCRTPWHTVSSLKGYMLPNAVSLCPALLEHEKQQRCTAGVCLFGFGCSVVVKQQRCGRSSGSR